MGKAVSPSPPCFRFLNRRDSEKFLKKPSLRDCCVGDTHSINTAGDLLCLFGMIPHYQISKMESHSIGMINRSFARSFEIFDLCCDFRWSRSSAHRDSFLVCTKRLLFPSRSAFDTVSIDFCISSLSLEPRVDVPLDFLLDSDQGSRPWRQIMKFRLGSSTFHHAFRSRTLTTTLSGLHRGGDPLPGVAADSSGNFIYVLDMLARMRHSLLCGWMKIK